MSRLVFETILNDVLSGINLHVALDSAEKERLYQEVLNYFGLIGGLNACEALETAWRDPYNQSEIKDFILAWLKKKTKKATTPAGVV